MRILIGGTLWHAHYTLTEVKEGKKEATRILTSFLPLGDMLRRDSTGNGDGGRGKNYTTKITKRER